MYVHLSPEDLGLIVASLSKLTIEPAGALRESLQRKLDESREPARLASDQAYVAAAQTRYNDDGTCEVDVGALVSISEDGGAYVMAWVWVDAEDAGICVQCGATNADNGEGYDGMCGNCADKAEVPGHQALNQVIHTN